MGVDLGRFVDKKVPQHLRCPACLEAAYPPVLVCWSEHALCRQCAVASESYACPTCRQGMVFPLKPSLFIKRAIEDYKIKCENDGCSWTGTVVNEKQHSNSCPFRKVFCKLCDSRYIFSQRDAHLDVCTEKTIDCPQGGRDCGGRSSGGRKKRRLMQEHLDKECAQWQCRAVPDCKTKTMRANLDEHEKGCRAAYDEIFQLKLTIEENAKLAEQRVPDKIVENLDFATSTDKALLPADEQQMFASTFSSQVVRLTGRPATPLSCRGASSVRRQSTRRPTTSSSSTFTATLRLLLPSEGSASSTARTRRLRSACASCAAPRPEPSRFLCFRLSASPFSSSFRPLSPPRDVQSELNCIPFH